MAKNPLVQAKGLHKSFASTVVLQGVDLEIHEGEAVVIIGPSGSGKTTLMRCINALETYDSGSLKLDGIEVGYNGTKRRSEWELAPIRANTGMVFQQFNLFPHLNALENVMLGLTKVRKMPAKEAQGRAMHWLDRVGLGGKTTHYPHQLSGGQQQRVGIARAVATEPKILLLDEITSALDPELVGEVMAVVRDLVNEGMTMLLVTHEMSFARDVGSRIVFMENANIQLQGSPEELLGNTSHERLRQFISRVGAQRAG